MRATRSGPRRSRIATHRIAATRIKARRLEVEELIIAKPGTTGRLRVWFDALGCPVVALQDAAGHSRCTLTLDELGGCSLSFFDAPVTEDDLPIPRAVLELDAAGIARVAVYDRTGGAGREATAAHPAPRWARRILRREHLH